MNFKPLPVRTIVFINFNSASPLKLTPLSLPEALKKFHEQARVTHNPEHARAFINWFVKLKCLDMQFSDNNKGINAIMNLFG